MKAIPYLLGGLLAVVGTVSRVDCFAATRAPKSLSDLSFPLLSVAGVLINAWLVWDGAPLASVAR